MNAMHYLYAAYAATWIIHLAYIGTVIRRYQRVRCKMEESKKSNGA